MEGIRAKFLQNKRMLDTLLRTKGHILVEAAKDKTWGTGLVLSRDDWLMTPYGIAREFLVKYYVKLGTDISLIILTLLFSHWSM